MANEFDGEVRIPVGLEADENSARKAGKRLSKAAAEEIKKTQNQKKYDDLLDKEYDSQKKLEKLARSRKALEREQKKIYDEQAKYANKRNKADKEQYNILGEKLKKSGDKLLDNSFEIKSEKEKLQLIQEEIASLQKVLGIKKEIVETSSGDRHRKGEFSDRDVTQEVANFDKYSDNLDTARSRIKKTSERIKYDVKQLVKTFEEQPSKSFAKEENDDIKLLQQDLAKTKMEAEEVGKTLTGPYKMEVDIRGLEEELQRVNREVEAQTEETERLKNNYKYADERAKSITSHLDEGTYSAEEMAERIRNIAEAEKFKTESAKAYDAAKVKLDGLVKKQSELTDTLSKTRDEYSKTVSQFESNNMNKALVDKAKPAVDQYRELNAQIDRIQDELTRVYNVANGKTVMNPDDPKVAKELEETLKGIGNEIKNIQETGSYQGESQFLKEQIAWHEKLLAEQKKRLQQEISDSRQVASSTYYQLRSLKMLGFAVDTVKQKMDSFGKSAITAAGNATKAITKLAFGFAIFPANVAKATKNMKIFSKNVAKATKDTKKFNREQNKLSKSQDKFNFSLKDAIKNILKYGLGIRSLFVLFNKLRNAMISGFENMAPQFDRVNQQLSSVITSFNQMKNAIAGAVQPILNVLAPALEKLSALLSEVAYKVASFIAALTGQKTVYKAIRYQLDYADSLDKTKKSAKEAKKELSGLDKLNVLTTDKDTGDDNPVKQMFEEVPIDQEMAGWAEKFKNWLKGFFAPFKEAWNREGKFVMAAWEKMLKSVKALLKDIARDFEAVWKSETMIQVWANLLHVLGDIFLIIANIADKLRIAWNHNQNGYKILLGIAEILRIITQGLRDAADYTVEWSKKLDFIPLFDALATTLWDDIIPAVQKIVNLFVWIYEHIFLELLKHFIEQTAPKLVKIFGNIIAAIGNIAEGILKALRRGNMGTTIVKAIEQIVDIIADTLVDITESTKEWAKELKFYKLVESIRDFLWDSKDTIQIICNFLKDLWIKVLEPIAKYLIEKALPWAFNLLGKIVNLVGIIVGKIQTAFNDTNGWSRILSGLKVIFERIELLLDNIVNSTIEWAKDIDFAPVVEAIAGFIEDAEGPIDNICTLLENLYNTIILPLAKYFVEKILPKAIELAGSILTVIGNIAGKFNEATTESTSMNRILESISRISDKVGKLIGDIAKKTEEWSKNINFEPLLESVAGWLESSEKPIDFICSTFSEFYEKVLLPFWSYIVEEGLPKLLSKLEEINNKIDWDKLKQKVNEFLAAFEPFLEKAWDLLIQLLGDLGEKISEFVNSEAFDHIVDKLIEWMNNFDPEEFAKALEFWVPVLVSMRGAIGAFSTILGGWTILQTVINFFNQRSLAKTLTTNTKAMKDLTTALDPMKNAASSASTAAETAASTATTAASTAGKAAKAGEAAAGASKAAAGGAVTAGKVAVGALAVFDGVMVSYDVGKLVKIHNDWEKADSEHETAVEKYCTNLETLYHTAGQKAVQEVSGTNVDLDKLYKEAQTATGTHKTELEKKYAELTKVYEDAGNEAVSMVACTNTTLEQEQQRARDEFEKMPHSMWEGFSKGWGDYFGKNATKGGLLGLISDAWTEFSGTFKSFFSGDKGGDTTETVGSDTAQGFNDGFTSTWDDNKDDITGRFEDVVTDGETTLDIQSPSKKTMSMGENTAQGFLDGFMEVWKKFDFKKSFNSVIDIAKKVFTNKALEPEGEQTVKGLERGMSSELNKTKSTATKESNNILKTFRNNLKSNSLVATGKNVINGLKTGLTSALNSALAEVTRICSQIISKAKQAFQTHSPSKVFIKIGENLMQGLVVGVDDEADSVEDSFNQLVPSDDLLKEFYNKFMNMMYTLTNNVTKMLDAMTYNINKSIKSLSKLDSLTARNRTLSAMVYDVPDIVKGSQLPSNKDFTQNLNIQIDLSKLPDIMKQAFIDAIKETADLQTEDETIIVNIDGKNIFQAVRSENTKYKKQHGVSAFA